MRNTNRWISKLANLLIDGRRSPRIPADLPVYLSCAAGCSKGHSIDLTGRGMAVHMTEAVAVGELVFLRIASHGLMGFAYVRHCRSVEGAYVVGLEFREPLTRPRDEETGWEHSRVTPQFAWDEAEA